MTLAWYWLRSRIGRSGTAGTESVGRSSPRPVGLPSSVGRESGLLGTSRLSWGLCLGSIGHLSDRSDGACEKHTHIGLTPTLSCARAPSAGLPRHAGCRARRRRRRKRDAACVTPCSCFFTRQRSARASARAGSWAALRFRESRPRGMAFPEQNHIRTIAAELRVMPPAICLVVVCLTTD